MAYSNRQRFLQKVSQHANIRQDVVEIVAKAIIDVSMEEIVNTGKFSFLSLFNIKAKRWGKGSYNLGDKKISEHQRLQPSLSKYVKELWRIRFDKLDGKDNIINKDNWRDIYQEYSRQRAKPTSEAPAIFNPFLDDDDDDEYV